MAGLQRTLFPVHFYDYIFLCGKNDGKYFFSSFKCRYCRFVVFYWVWHNQRVEKKLWIFSIWKNGLYIYIIQLQPQPHKEKWINLVVSFLPQWHRKINHCFSLLFEVGVHFCFYCRQGCKLFAGSGKTENCFKFSLQFFFLYR